jgi:hypothetical protein
LNERYMTASRAWLLSMPSPRATMNTGMTRVMAGRICVARMPTRAVCPPVRQRAIE